MRTRIIHIGHPDNTLIALQTFYQQLQTEQQQDRWYRKSVEQQKQLCKMKFAVRYLIEQIER